MNNDREKIEHILKKCRKDKGKYLGYAIGYAVDLVPYIDQIIALFPDRDIQVKRLPDREKEITDIAVDIWHESITVTNGVQKIIDLFPID